MPKNWGRGQSISLEWFATEKMSVAKHNSKVKQPKTYDASDRKKFEHWYINFEGYLNMMDPDMSTMLKSLEIHIEKPENTAKTEQEKIIGLKPPLGIGEYLVSNDLVKKDKQDLLSGMVYYQLLQVLEGKTFNN